MRYCGDGSRWAAEGMGWGEWGWGWREGRDAERNGEKKVDLCAMRRNVHAHIRGRMSNGDVRTALSPPFFLSCSPLQNSLKPPDGVLKKEFKPLSRLPGGFLLLRAGGGGWGGCVALPPSRCSARFVRIEHSRCVAGWSIRAQRLLSLVLTAMHARRGDCARSRRISSSTSFLSFFPSFFLACRRAAAGCRVEEDRMKNKCIPTCSEPTRAPC